MAFLPKTGGSSFRWVILTATSLMAACADQPRPHFAAIVPGARYVAMGSSFAAGPGVTQSADTPANRCQRSADNYPRQLARKRQLDLVDVSCGGATTAHLLAPWRELPAQIDAVTADTKLVTITIGGNDVGFAGGLMAASCADDALRTSADVATMCASVKAYARSNPQAMSAPDEAAWTGVAQGLDEIAREVRRKAPHARIIFVDYIRVVPDGASCANVPLSAAALALARTHAARLAQITADAARRAGADVVRASQLSQGHDACAGENWATGIIRPAGVSTFAPYHPNLAAMTAIADALDAELGK